MYVPIITESFLITRRNGEVRNTRQGTFEEKKVGEEDIKPAEAFSTHNQKL